MTIEHGTTRQILIAGDPRLGQPCQPVQQADPALPSELADLAATLRRFREETGFGRAISANQIGIAKRAVVFDLGAGPIAMLNPTITWRSDETDWIWDDCMSVPRELARVERARSVSLRYCDSFGRSWDWDQLGPELSELFQHELDHLDGILMTDHAAGPDDIAPAAQRHKLISPQRRQPNLTAELVAETANMVDPRFTETPFVEFETLSAAIGTRVSLKIETLNPIRCFKGRGASAFVADHAATRPGVALIAASAGNWGQALALSCRDLDVALTIYAATTANRGKVDRMRQLGATVILTGDDFDAAKEAARSAAADTGAHFAEDGLHDIVSAGHGSCAIEITRAADLNGTRIDDVLVPVGNGALLNGMTAWFAAASPATRTIGVCAAGAPAMHLSFQSSESAMETTQRVETIADGLAVRTPIPEAVNYMRDHVSDTVLVADEHMETAQRLLATHAGCIAEPSGAAGLAALVADPSRWANRHCVVIVTGSNV